MPRTPATLAANVTENVIQIVSGDMTFTLREPIDLETKRDHGRFIVAYPPLNIDVDAENETKALEMFAEAFGDAWKYLTDEDRDLTRDAAQLKRKFEKLVVSVDDMSRATKHATPGRQLRRRLLNRRLRHPA